MGNSDSALRALAEKRVHFIGIGGASMSGLAKLFLELGVRVTGSDERASHKTQALSEAGVPVYIGQKRGQVSGADLVVYTAAIREDNPERAEARELGIASMERSELLGLITASFPTSICISGTHGKTTTTSMISQMFLEAGQDPTVHIGGELAAFGGSTRLGKSEYCIVEACEFARSFLKLTPKIAVILNIDRDHLDCYGDIEHIEAAFSQFAGKTPSGGWVVGCGDDERVRRVLASCGRRTRLYGFQPSNELRAEQLSFDDTGCASFTATLYGHPVAEVELRIPGRHSVLNALATIAVALICEIPMSLVCATLSRFENPKRRFELTSITDGVHLYTDYSHTPEEMKNAIRNAKFQPHGTLWAIWQPHTFARTRALYSEFLECFGEADRVVITDIMAAREDPDPTLTSGMLEKDLLAKGVSAKWTPTFDDAEAYLRANWKAGDIALSMGCGNIDLLNEQIALHGDTKPEEMP